MLIDRSAGPDVRTFDMNATSPLRVNEVNLIVHDRGHVEAVAALFRRDVEPCRRVTAEVVAGVPVGSRLVDSAAARVLDGADRLR